MSTENPNHNPLFQYISIQDFVNDFILSQGQDSYVVNENPTLVLFHARKGLQELTFNTLKEIKAIEVEMFSNGLIYLPSDFVGLVRLSYVDEKGNAHVLIKDDRTTLGSSYLQDHEYNLLLDHEDKPLEADRTESTRPKVKEVNFDLGCKDKNLLAKGDYVFDKANSTIAFLNVLPSELFLVEYFSDGSNEDKIHKFAEDALYNYVYWKLISNNRNVPQNEKISARQEFYNSERIAKNRLNPLSWIELRNIYTN